MKSDAGSGQKCGDACQVFRRAPTSTTEPEPAKIGKVAWVALRFRAPSRSFSMDTALRTSDRWMDTPAGPALAAIPSEPDPIIAVIARGVRRSPPVDQAAADRASIADAAQRRRPDLKVLFITGYAEGALIQRGSRAKLRDLSKLFTWHLLGF